MSYDCDDCKGAGTVLRRIGGRPNAPLHRVRCWTCNGNGLDPAKFFRWGDHPDLPSVPPSAAEGRQ